MVLRNSLHWPTGMWRCTASEPFESGIGRPRQQDRRPSPTGFVLPVKMPRRPRRCPPLDGQAGGLVNRKQGDGLVMAGNRRRLLR